MDIGASAVMGDLEGGRFGSGIPRHLVARLDAIAQVMEVPARSVLLHEGEETTRVGVVLEGRLVLTERIPGRGPVTLLTVERGDVFGWSALLPPFRATSTVTSVEPSRIATLPGPALRGALRSDPELAAAVYREMFDAVARRLMATRHQLLDVYRLETYEPW
jgi:CRP/FNR family cyclic AMP-dependent transcriptional regulator